MIAGEDFLVACLFFLAAALYASVGHAGASAYLAVMAFLNLPGSTMGPTALILNLFVATVATLKFARAGCFSWPLFWPFAVASIPAAYLGGLITLPDVYFKPLVGLVLLFAAGRLLLAHSAAFAESETRAPRLGAALTTGLMLGFLAGLTRTGGGIFLSPLLVLLHWATLRRASGVAAAFILVNSAAGLAAHLADARTLPAIHPLWIIAVLAGGYLGAEFGSRRFQTLALRRLLAVVLVIAGVKLLGAFEGGGTPSRGPASQTVASAPR